MESKKEKVEEFLKILNGNQVPMGDGATAYFKLYYELRNEPEIQSLSKDTIGGLEYMIDVFEHNGVKIRD